MGLLSPKPPPEPDPPEPDPDIDMLETVAAFVNLGLDELDALACANSDLSVSALREFLKRHPGCDTRTAVAILL